MSPPHLGKPNDDAPFHGGLFCLARSQPTRTHRQPLSGIARRGAPGVSCGNPVLTANGKCLALPTAPVGRQLDHPLPY